MSDKKPTQPEKKNMKPFGITALVMGIAGTALGIFEGFNLNGAPGAVALAAPGLGFALAGILILRGGLDHVTKDKSDRT